ncbi:hypothetical protein RchiOBHm_Chr2g0138171 [Rosa chinensis]|uniref:Uncharacterized protein n=1 Tax=Rosa chinensis TaxID=74649 RepID=A0A2P6RWU1_ROSCH|nr:hypothetical protein RchiOBHm_Chr2g0138171 [Rosa chinensis]
MGERFGQLYPLPSPEKAMASLLDSWGKQELSEWIREVGMEHNLGHTQYNL